VAAARTQGLAPSLRVRRNLKGEEMNWTKGCCSAEGHPGATHGEREEDLSALQSGHWNSSDATLVRINATKGITSEKLSVAGSQCYM
jgi:hypothetical protein